MIKIRNKRIALLLVLTMLATMFVGVGTATAAGDLSDVASGYTTVLADDDQPIGNLTVTPRVGFEAQADGFAAKMTVSFADDTGITFNDTGKTSKTYTLGVLTDLTPVMVPVSTMPDFNIDIPVDFTGTSINASVKVYVEDNLGQTLYEKVETQLVAKIATNELKVSAEKAKTVDVGDWQKGADITVKEVTSGNVFQYGDEIILSILTDGVTWDDFDLVPTDGSWSEDSDSTSKKLVLYFDGTNTPIISKAVVTPILVVRPTTKEGTEIKIKVSGDNIDTATFTVAKVGSKDMAVKVKNADKDFVYRGQAATFDDVSVTLNPGGKLETVLNDDDWFSITLPTGVKWQEVPLDLTGANIDFEGFYDSGATAWFDVNGDQIDTFKLTDFAVVADANAVVGDLEIKFDGALEGSYKIGSIKNAFTIETVPFALTTGATGIQGAKIVITETEEEALKPNHDDDYGYWDYKGDFHNYDCFDIVLPAGVSFVGTPEIDVTEGDIEVEWDDVDDYADFRTLQLDFTDISSQTSTIEISGLEFSVLSQPGLGDLKALVGQDYNIASNKALETLVLGAVATNPTAVYVIGAPTFTVNGAVESVVTPSYIKNGRTYLAIRDIATGLGIAPMNVLWDAAASKVTLIKGAKIVQVTIGSPLMNVNGVVVTMDVAPEISNGRTMLPAAFIAQAFGATASWDAATQTVTIK